MRLVVNTIQTSREAQPASKPSLVVVRDPTFIGDRLADALAGYEYEWHFGRLIDQIIAGEVHDDVEYVFLRIDGLKVDVRALLAGFAPKTPWQTFKSYATLGFARVELSQRPRLFTLNSVTTVRGTVPSHHELDEVARGIALANARVGARR
jgi:hypothetical protein